MDPSTLGPVAIAQIVAVWLIQRLKEAKWFPWLTANSATASRIVAYAIAVLTTAGITWQWNAAQGQLVLNGLMWQTVVQGLWTGLAGVVTNELTYMLIQIKAQTNMGAAIEAAQKAGHPAEPPKA